MDTKKRVRKTKAKTVESVEVVENTPVVNEEILQVKEEVQSDQLPTIMENIHNQIRNFLEPIQKERDEILKKYNSVGQLHKLEISSMSNKFTEEQKELKNQISALTNEKTTLLCENVKLKDKLDISEKMHKQTIADMEDLQNNLANVKFQFETYQTDSKNSYSVLKTLYDDAKQETSVFMHRIEKCTKEHEATKNELQSLKQEYNERLERDIQSFKNVSLLNTYLKEIEHLKNEISILNQKLNTNKKLLDQSNKENKELNYKLDTMSNEEEVVDQTEEVPESEEVQVEEVEEVEEVQEEVVEIDVSKFDIIEVDDKEYYLDLDNNILDKESLQMVGTLTEEGDAVFNE